jgi:hypothetical protein
VQERECEMKECEIHERVLLQLQEGALEGQQEGV